MRGINIEHLKSLLAYAKSEHTHVRLERNEMDQIIRELARRRREGKKLRLKRNKQVKQIVNMAEKLRPSANSGD